MAFYIIIFWTLLSSLLGYFRFKYSYWDFQGVQQLKHNFLFGTLFKLKSINISELLHEVYVEFKGKTKIAGTYIFTRPIAVVTDLDLVKAILVKDFNIFVDRHKVENNDTWLEPLSEQLFTLHGEKWRSMRTKLTPTFSTDKMKYIFPTIVKVANELKCTLAEEIESADNVVEVHELLGRFTSDVIGTCILGIDCNSLKDPDVEFYRIGSKFFMHKRSSIKWRLFKKNYQNILKFFGTKRFGGDMEKYIMRVVRETVALREQEKIQRNDFMDLLIELKNKTDDNNEPGLTIEQIAAQVYAFFLADFQSSSSNMSYALYELAKNEEIEEKVRAEIKQVLEKHNRELTYEAMMEMTYLDQVVSETLRKYPALASLTRIAKEEYKIPGTTIKLEKDTRIFIPVKEIHYDSSIYDNPEEFRPERFSAYEVQRRHPQAFLGFGDGPRNCIGHRFGRMQVQIGLIALLRAFKFSMDPQTPDIMEVSRHTTVTVPTAGVWLKAEKL